MATAAIWSPSRTVRTVSGSGLAACLDGSLPCTLQTKCPLLVTGRIDPPELDPDSLAAPVSAGDGHRDAVTLRQ
jgi:hypothetical protein